MRKNSLPPLVRSSYPLVKISPHNFNSWQPSGSSLDSLLSDQTLVTLDGLTKRPLTALPVCASLETGGIELPATHSLSFDLLFFSLPFFLSRAHLLLASRTETNPNGTGQAVVTVSLRPNT